jgi:hypothetical protein
MIERAGDAPSESSRKTTLNPQTFFKTYTKTMPSVLHGLLRDESCKLFKTEEKYADSADFS